MRIGVELRQIRPGSSGGLVLLLRELIKVAIESHPRHEFFIFCISENEDLIGTHRANEIVEVLEEKDYFERLDTRLREVDAEVLIRSYPLDIELQYPDSRQLYVIPDLQHEEYPEFFSAEVLEARRRAFSQALSRAGAIGTISRFARETIVEHPLHGGSEVVLIPPALRSDIASRTQGSADQSVLGKIPADTFFFYPANFWPHKNHRRLLEAFEIYRERHGGRAALVLTGDDLGESKSLLRPFSHLPVTYLGYVDEATLGWLYEHALGLLFFSLYEGFGMPLLEAFWHGLPVACSNTTSLPETAADAALKCNPLDTLSMASSMNRLSEDLELRRDLKEKGKKRLAEYTWEESARTLVEACVRLADRERPSIERRVPGEYEPLVSIVTPSLNQGRFIRDTIESVLGQSYPRVEYLVVDGGSTDETIPILESYDDRVRWLSEQDRGQAHAINKGLRQTSGEIVAFLNSDDVLHRDAVKNVVGFLGRRPQCDLVYGRGRYIDEEGHKTGEYATAPYSFGRLMQDCCICQPAAFWRRSVLEEVGSFNEDLDFAMDYEYWLRVDRGGHGLQFMDEVLAFSRMYPENKTMRARRDFYREIFDICRRWGGYVHLNYYLGLWHHRLCEGNRGLAAVARRGLWKLMARLHFARDIVRERTDGSRLEGVVRFWRVFRGWEGDLPGLRDWRQGM